MNQDEINQIICQRNKVRAQSGQSGDYYGYTGRCVDALIAEITRLRQFEKQAEEKEKESVPEVKVDFDTKANLNPCDTLTRQHVELIENEKVYRDTYKPTMIPGCPNDVKKENKDFNDATLNLGSTKNELK